MKKEEFSSSLMDKLAGNLSENEARAFEASIAEKKHLQDEYQLFSEIWDQLENIDTDHEVPESLSQNFYQQLADEQQKQENSFTARLHRLKEELFSASPLARNLSFGLFLLAFGFILGGKFNTNKIEVNHTIQPAESNSEAASFVLSTDKIQQIHSIKANPSIDDETIQRLKSIIETEENTNVRLAALNKLNLNTKADGSLKQFYIQQLEREQSPLIQVELLNSIIENSRTKESINTMETMLSKRSLNPIVEEKIHKDLPVLRASYVE